MLLSIIIPVYRTQDTLPRCMESILGQSFVDYEVILVDDGSPDECPRLCDEYARKDKRISVIHKVNGGLSDARNAGIAQAKGEYITFIDSDDAIAEGTLQLLMQELEDHPCTDILEYPIKERMGNPAKENLLSFAPKEYHDAIDYWLGERAYNHAYSCNKIYRRELFRDIRFPKGKCFEDTLTTPYIIGLVPTEHGTTAPIIRVTNVGMYLYIWNGNGITATAKYEDLYNQYSAHVMSLTSLFRKIEGHEKEIVNKHHASLQQFMLSILNVLIDMYNVSGRFERPDMLVSKVRWLHKTQGLTSYKLILLMLLGYHGLCRLYNIVYRIRTMKKP